MVAPFHCSLVPKVGLSERRPAGGNFIAWREAGAVPGTASPLREAQLPRVKTYFAAQECLTLLEVSAHPDGCQEISNTEHSLAESPNGRKL